MAKNHLDVVDVSHSQGKDVWAGTPNEGRRAFIETHKDGGFTALGICMVFKVKGRATEFDAFIRRMEAAGAQVDTDGIPPVGGDPVSPPTSGGTPKGGVFPAR